jgi:TolA-binding protein
MRGLAILLTALLLAGGVLPAALAQKAGTDEAALATLNSARRAFNEGNCAVAAERFREFLRTFPEHRESVSAKFGLAISLMGLPDKDCKAVLEALQPLVGRNDFPDRPLALYYQGAAHRSLAEQGLTQAEGKPPEEAKQLRAAAADRMGQAAQSFAASAGALAARIRDLPAGADPAADYEWLALAQADHRDMLLRTGKFKEAADSASAFLADPSMAKSRYRDLALYQQGYATFAIGDNLEAGRALSQLAPFQQEFSGHARYLLGRSHHMAGERPEAAAQYKAVVDAFDEQRRAAQAMLKLPQATGNPNAITPEQRAAAEKVLNTPPADYVVRSLFYTALLAAEDRRFPEATEKFAAFVQQYPKSPLAAEAQLRRGYCLLENRNYPVAMEAFQPLRDHPQLSDQALWWLARAQVGAADPANAQAYAQSLATALENLRLASERAAELAKSDTAAKVRRGDILLDMADTQQLAGQFKEAAATCQKVLAENANPDRAEEALQRLATALHMAGQYRESDEVCQRFLSAYPKSTLLPAIKFRQAENGYLAATALAVTPEAANRRDEVNRLFGGAVAHYANLLKQFPDFPHANLARQGMAMAQYRMGQYAEAIAVLSKIPEPDCAGDLATVPYLLADCLIRTLPPETDDALQAAQLIEQAEKAVRLLDAFLGGQAKRPEVPDAMLKLGYCCQRIGGVMAAPAEMKKSLEQARQTYEKLLQQFPQHPAVASAVFERAKCMAVLGNSAGSVNELRRFQADPLRGAAVAPLALLHLSSLLRTSGKAAEAAAVMADCRTRDEAALAKDSSRAEWVPMLQYEHALALKESGKGTEAMALFEALAKQFAGRPEAVNATWRAGQCRREQAVVQVAGAHKTLARQGATPEETEAAKRAVEEGVATLRRTAEAFNAQAAAIGAKARGSEPHLRILYETAWCYRSLADAETEAARSRMRRDAADRLQAKLSKDQPAGQPQTVALPDIPLALVPPQPSEKTARDLYQSLISAGSRSPLVVQARFELAEILSRRGDPDGALELLAESLAANPPAELADAIRLRMAVCFLDRRDGKAALAHAQPVAANAASPFVPEAQYVAGEAFIQQQDWPKAVERLVAFRDQSRFQNVPEVSDRALLRLGHALAQTGQWEPGRAAYETLVQRFPQSPWCNEARYGIGWAWQNLKQHDNAVAAYSEVTRRTTAEVAARAQVQIGLCRLEQKRFPEAAQALMVVPLTYDYPEWQGQALCEAARAYVEMNQQAEAVRILQRVVKDFSKSTWAQVAQKRLTEMK